MMRYPYWNDRYYDMMPVNGWWLGLEILGFILLAIFIIILYRNHLKHLARVEGPPTALDIAKTRLAKGEISPEEFAAMKEHLK
jgi:uncharacterized membrane protein